MKNKLKVAYIGQKGIENVIGGVETHVRELSARAVKAGYDVTVYARPYTTKSRIKYVSGVIVKRLLSLHTKHLDTISHVFLSTWHAIFSKVDIIHYHGVGPSLLSFIPRIFAPQIRVITTFHSIDREHAKWGIFARLMLRLGEWTACTFAHNTITVSQELALYCYKHYKKRTISIYNGIVGPMHAEPELIKNVFGLERDNYILVLSRLIKHKNIHQIIEAFKNTKTDVKLAVVGEGAFTDKYVDSLKKQAKGDPRIVFCGACQGKALNELLSNCLFYINASQTEGCPTTSLEVMSYGKLALVADLKINREVLGKRGHYFLGGDVNDLREKMEWLLSERKYIHRIHNDLAGHALKSYHWDNLAPRVFNLYDQVQGRDRLIESPYPLGQRRI